MRKLFLGAALLVALGCGGGGEVASIVQPPPGPDYDIRFDPGVDPMNLTANVEYHVFTIRKSTGQPRNGARIDSASPPGTVGTASTRSADGTGIQDGEVWFTFDTVGMTGHVWGVVDGKEFGKTAFSVTQP